MAISEEEAEQLINYTKQMEEELDAERSREQEMQKANFLAPEEQENLVKWQLDMKEDKDKIYHLLRGDKIVQDKDTGEIYYEEAKDDRFKPFNEFGVQLIMNILSFYLSKNIILSNYSEDTINWKVYDFGNEVADLIFNRYEEMGMDTKEKIKMYPMIVRELVDTVHSAYLRAYHGGERESIRTARFISQNEPLMSAGMIQGQNQFQQQKKARWFNPLSWGRR